MNQETSSPGTPALEEELCHGKRERFLRHYLFNSPVKSVACPKLTQPALHICGASQVLELAVQFVLLLSVILLFDAEIVDIFVHCTELLGFHSVFSLFVFMNRILVSSDIQASRQLFFDIRG